jgi:hypothetical protein
MAGIDSDRAMRLVRELSAQGVNDPDGVKRLLSSVADGPRPKKRNVRAAVPETKTQLRAEAIVNETAPLVGITGSISPCYFDSINGEWRVVPTLPQAILSVPKEFAWTKTLAGYEDARMSAVNALHRLWASGQAAAAGHNSKTPRVDIFLFQIRAGRIDKNDPSIPKMIDCAEKHGFPCNIRERIIEEFHNAEKRVGKRYCGVNIANSLFYDLNFFRMVLAVNWVGLLFWLMPDRLIADFLSSHNFVPEDYNCNRQTISEAIKQMRLLKSKPPIVKSIGSNFRWFFTEGYPPKT